MRSHDLARRLYEVFDDEFVWDETVDFWSTVTADLPAAEDAVRSQTIRVQIAFLCMMLDVEQQNGGFDQWICNPSGIFVRETIRIAREIGAPDLATLIESMMKRLPAELFSSSQSDRCAAAQPLRDVDEEFLDEYDEIYQSELRDGFLAQACEAAGIELERPA